MTVHGAGPWAGRDLPEAQRLIRGKCYHPRGTFVEFPMDEVEGSIVARFTHVVHLYGSRIAVRTRDRVLTYAQLHASTNRIARAIEVAARGVENVGLIVGHGLPAVVAILATLKTGKAFVLMDPRFPLERLAFVLGDSRAGALLVDAPHRAIAERLARTGLPIVDMDEAIDVYPDDGAPRVVCPDTLAGLLYTSGSTGRPKGVPRTHRHFLALVRNWTDAAHICPQDRMTLLASSMSTPLVAPRDEVERLLARIWAEVLQLDEVGVEDDFLDLGGDSLLAARVVSRANAAFMLDLPMHVLFASPTVAAMAAAIGRAALQSADHAAVEGLLATIHTLSDAEVRNLLTGKLAHAPTAEGAPTPGGAGRQRWALLPREEVDVA